MLISAQASARVMQPASTRRRSAPSPRVQRARNSQMMSSMAVETVPIGLSASSSASPSMKPWLKPSV